MFLCALRSYGKSSLLHIVFHAAPKSGFLHQERTPLLLVEIVSPDLSQSEHLNNSSIFMFEVLFHHMSSTIPRDKILREYTTICTDV